MERESPVQIFTHYLKSQGLSVTKVRRQIAETIFASRSHVTAVDLWARVRNSEKNVSMAAVYRTLDLLIEGGLVRKLDLGGTHAQYEPLLGQGHHEHLICTRCAKIVEFAVPEIEEKLHETVERYGFLHQEHELKIFGLCPDCREISPHQEAL